MDRLRPNVYAVDATPTTTVYAALDGPVATAGPTAEGNAFAAGFTTIMPIDGNYGSDELGLYDRIAALLGTTFGVPSSTVPFLQDAVLA